MRIGEQPGNGSNIVSHGEMGKLHSAKETSDNNTTEKPQNELAKKRAAYWAKIRERDKYRTGSY